MHGAAAALGAVVRGEKCLWAGIWGILRLLGLNCQFEPGLCAQQPHPCLCLVQFGEPMLVAGSS